VHPSRQFEAPHCGHKRASGAAHFAQNLRPSRLSLPHFEQRIGSSPKFSRPMREYRRNDGQRKQMSEGSNGKRQKRYKAREMNTNNEGI
jgi:hypothetical protein